MQKFMTFLLTVAIILVGWIMISNECSIWEIIEAESNLIVCGGLFIALIWMEDGMLQWFRWADGAERLKSILFIPLCVAACMLGARYGGEFIARCIDALLEWKPLDLKAEFTIEGSVLGEFPKNLWVLGAAYAPNTWIICSKMASRVRMWPVALVAVFVLGSLPILVNYIVALICAIVVLGIVAILAIAFGSKDEDEEERKRRESGW